MFAVYISLGNTSAAFSSLHQPEYKMLKRTGRCLCGDVQYEIVGEPFIARICWCQVCQKISGNGTANAIFPSAAIAVSGAMSSFTSSADSGNEITRHFCPKCGSHLFANASASPQFRVVRLGTFDDPSSIVPTINMWVSSAPSWACMDPALKHELRQPSAVSPLRSVPGVA